jgi:hypothetical protein
MEYYETHVLTRVEGVGWKGPITHTPATPNLTADERDAEADRLADETRAAYGCDLVVLFWHGAEVGSAFQHPTPVSAGGTTELDPYPLDGNGHWAGPTNGESVSWL